VSPVSTLESAAITAAAVADGLHPGLDLWWRWHYVDDHVMQAFEHLSHQQIESIGDLLKLVDVKAYKLESEQFANLLKGHIGEWHVQEHLADAGFSVAMPPTSNQPGWDMLVNGQEMNVKTVADAGAQVAGHFAKYPDIAAIVPGDAANISADALHFDPSNSSIQGFPDVDHLTIVDHALSHVDIAVQYDHVKDVLLDHDLRAGPPWVTLAVSSFREVRLLASRKTDVLRASKNVAVDTVASGAGLGGAELGGFIGTFIAPGIGTAVGAAVGGMLGALGGRWAAKSVKKLPLDAAKSAYLSARDDCEAKEQELSKVAAEQWTSAQAAEATELRQFSRSSISRCKDRLSGLQHTLERAVCLDVAAAERVLGQAQVQLKTLLAKDSQVLRQSVPRWATPWAGLVAPALAQRRYCHSLEARRWVRRKAALLGSWKPNAGQTSAVFDHVLSVPGCEQEVDAYLLAVASVRQRVVRDAAVVQKAATEEVVIERAAAVSRLKQRWEIVCQQVEVSIRPFLDSLREALEQYRAELGKAGRSV